jgi:hypothetical protein
MSQLSIGTYFPDNTQAQQPADIAVVMPTLARPCIAQAIRRVFEQDFSGRIQILIGVDIAEGDPAVIEAIAEQRPSNVSLLLLQLPYSTSVRHGGVHTALDGGSLRSILSFMTNAQYVAFLDDDNEWRPDHLSKLHKAIQGKAWAYSQRMLVDMQTDKDLGVDEWDSVGPNRGRFAAQGGFVDTNCLMVDKIVCARALGRWSESGTGKPGLTADRNFFGAIKDAPHGVVEEPTVRYAIRPTNVLHTFLKQATLPQMTVSVQQRLRVTERQI